MRLNESILPNDTFFAESRRFLEKTIEDIRYNPPPPISRVPDKDIPQELIDFYETYYVPLDARGHIPSDCVFPKNLEVSSYEDKIIDFCTAPRAETRICVLHGHTGVGKSTLLRRVIYYIYPRCPGLARLFYPVYLRLTPDVVDEDPDVLLRRFEKIVCESTYAIVRPELESSLSNILKELNTRSSQYGQFPSGIIEDIIAVGVEEWMNAALQKEGAKEEFLLNVITLLIRSHRMRIVLVVDDVDRHSRDVHTSVFLALDSLGGFGIASLVSMRTSTFEDASTKLLEYRDQRIELRLNPDLIERIFSRRVSILQERVHLHPEYPFRLPQYEEVSGKDIVSSFCQLMTRPACMKALVGLSNTNLKSVFAKLDLMTKSEAFSDTFIVRQLLERDILRDDHLIHGKIWVFYHLLLGNYAGTYRRDRETHKAGLVNVFDCSEPSQNPWKHFIRLNLLTYLHRIWRLTRNEEEYVSVAELHKKVRRVFGTTIQNSLFLDAIWSLIESELVFMASCRKYTHDMVKRELFSDGVRVSYAGRFYLENLLHKVEYLYFIKDDIDWRVGADLGALRPAKRDSDRPAKFTDALKALRVLLKEEYTCLGLLRAYWNGTDHGEDRLARYRDQFSPYGSPEAGLLSFCEVVLRNYKRFMSQRLGAGYRSSEVAHLIAELEDIGSENEGISKAFLQA